MAVTPRQVKTLTEQELQWMKTQLQAIDQEVFTRYDGTNPLEIVLAHDGEHRAFVNEAFFRRAVSEYARSGWQIEDAGQQELLNWMCIAGAMQELGHQPQILDYVESYIFNSNKCVALFKS